MRRRFIDVLSLVSFFPHLSEGGEVLTGQMSSEALFLSPIKEKGTIPEEFSSQLRGGRGAQPCSFTRDSRFHGS